MTDQTQNPPEPLLIDGLLVSKWSRPVFESVRSAGVTAANCTCAVWEGFEHTMVNIAALKRLVKQSPDLLTQIYDAGDIVAAADAGRSGVILGFQNSSPIEDRLEYLPLFHELGVRVIQLTYNTMNFVGSGCYETNDGGLSDFGRDLVSEMNRLGVLVDLSHVGRRTTSDALASSTKPVAFTHVCPYALKAHPRNKTDEEMRSVANTGGIVGVTLPTWFYQRGVDSTVEDYLDAIEHVINVVGEEHIAIGSDFTEGYDADFVEWILRDKGTGRALVPDPRDVVITTPRGLDRIEDLGSLAQSMQQRAWTGSRIERVLGANWLRLYRDVWSPGASTAPVAGQ